MVKCKDCKYWSEAHGNYWGECAKKEHYGMLKSAGWTACESGEIIDDKRLRKRVVVECRHCKYWKGNHCLRNPQEKWEDNPRTRSFDYCSLGELSKEEGEVK